MIRDLLSRFINEIFPRSITKWQPFHYYEWRGDQFLVFARLMADGIIQFKTVRIADNVRHPMPFAIDTLQVLRELCEIAQKKDVEVRKSGNVFNIIRK